MVLALRLFLFFFGENFSRIRKKHFEKPSLLMVFHFKNLFLRSFAQQHSSRNSSSSSNIRTSSPLIIVSAFSILDKSDKLRLYSWINFTCFKLLVFIKMQCISTRSVVQLFLSLICVTHFSTRNNEKSSMVHLLNKLGSVKGQVGSNRSFRCFMKENFCHFPFGAVT